MLGFIYALFSAISFSTNNIFLKKIGNKINATQSLILVYILVSIITLFFLLIFGNYKNPLNIKIFILIFFVGFFGAIGIISFLKSFEKLSVTSTLAISNFYPFITLFLYFIFFNKKIIILNLFAMLIVFFGILLSLNKTNKFKIKFEKIIIYPIITALSWGSYYIFLDLLSKEIISNFNILFYSEFSIFLNILLFYFLFIKKKMKFNLLQIKSKTILFNSFFAAFFAVLGVLFFILSLKNISVTISTSIISSQVIFSSIFAYFIFKEKLNKIQILGIIIVFTGLVIFQIL